MLEVELKAVVVDPAATRKELERAGAKLTYEGRLLDRRYDIESRELADRAEALRARHYESRGSTRTYLDWKGPTESQGGYKIREEISTQVDDFIATEHILDKVGFVFTMDIDREAAQYDLSAGA